MKVLVTGAKGFIGRNLVTTLKQDTNLEVIEVDIKQSVEELKQATLESEFIFHLAGVNRPKNDQEFFEGNTGLTETIIETLKQQLNDLMFNELNTFKKVIERCQGEGYQYEETFRVEGEEFNFFIRLKPVRDECSHIFVYIK